MYYQIHKKQGCRITIDSKLQPQTQRFKTELFFYSINVLV